jgi:Protein of unknown function (DUF5672)
MKPLFALLVVLHLKVTTESCPGISKALSDRCARCLFYEKMSNVAPPALRQRVWANGSSSHSLALVLMEPRPLETTERVVWNFAHAYGGTNASLWLMHSILNAYQLQILFGGWKHVNHVRLKTDGFPTGPHYSRYVLNPAFWDTFSAAEFVLIFHVDSAIFRTIPDVFFQYDYVGAPWTHHPCTQNGKCADVGNGGLTLRRVSTMRTIAETWIQSDAPEDVVYSANTANVAPANISLNFSTEMIFSPTSAGTHRPWTVLKFEDVSNLLAKPFLGESPCG